MGEWRFAGEPATESKLDFLCIPRNEPPLCAAVGSKLIMTQAVQIGHSIAHPSERSCMAAAGVPHGADLGKFRTCLRTLRRSICYGPMALNFEIGPLVNAPEPSNKLHRRHSMPNDDRCEPCAGGWEVAWVGQGRAGQSRS